MSANLDYHDLWHDLYEFVMSRKSLGNQYVFIAHVMEEMDPRLIEEEEMAQQVLEAVKTFLKP